MRMRYRDGVEWIALNDETASMDLQEIAGLASTCMLADLSGHSPLSVARAVLKRRTALDAYYMSDAGIAEVAAYDSNEDA